LQVMSPQPRRFTPTLQWRQRIPIGPFAFDHGFRIGHHPQIDGTLGFLKPRFRSEWDAHRKPGRVLAANLRSARQISPRSGPLTAGFRAMRHMRSRAACSAPDHPVRRGRCPRAGFQAHLRRVSESRGGELRLRDAPGEVALLAAQHARSGFMSRPEFMRFPLSRWHRRQ
jgi:hypothetical protein